MALVKVADERDRQVLLGREVSVEAIGPAQRHAASMSNLAALKARAFRDAGARRYANMHKTDALVFIMQTVLPPLERVGRATRFPNLCPRRLA